MIEYETFSLLECMSHNHCYTTVALVRRVSRIQEVRRERGLMQVTSDDAVKRSRGRD